MTNQCKYISDSDQSHRLSDDELQGSHARAHLLKSNRFTGQSRFNVETQCLASPKTT
ncbi:hypothetical protein [Membranihabitans marinus]|uniref:hypothetical protein n=1 Tax=Membranihabitans marinus TaxID=1227546 RepID=UPI001F46892D|nr:hypothetical protein [Membranihabitans marinus]